MKPGRKKLPESKFKDTVAIRLPGYIIKMLKEISETTGQNRSSFILDAVKHKLGLK